MGSLFDTHVQIVLHTTLSISFFFFFSFIYLFIFFWTVCVSVMLKLFLEEDFNLGSTCSVILRAKHAVLLPNLSE